MKKTYLFILVYFCAAFTIQAQNNGNIIGKLTDEQTNEPLVGANILIEGTSLGTTTDNEGGYSFRNLQVGSDTLIFRYIGYKTKKVEAVVSANKTVEINVKLNPEAIVGKEVIVTAQLEGQLRAINQQLSSNTIVNVVSSDKIQELPDANVAESIGRLPGISLQRDAGEGSKVVIRGLSPKFSSITVNGVKIPATDPNDRSVDLSMISSDVLAGIEVFKALTPDKDGDAIGGTVNLVLKKAPEDLHFNVRLQDGYNNHADEFGQYKGSVSLSNRFFDNRLGVFVTGSKQKVNRSSHLLTADYEDPGTNTATSLDLDNANLTDNVETRDRTGGELSLDYDLGNGGISFNTFYSKTNRDRITRRKRYRTGALRVEYDLNKQNIITNLISNSVSGTHKLDLLTVDWQGSYSRSVRKIPYSNYGRFQELAAFNNGLITDKGPKAVPPFAKNNLGQTWFQYGTFSPEISDDRNLTANLDLKYLINFGDFISGYLKAGGKYRAKRRNRNTDEFRTDFAVTDDIGQANPDKFQLYNGHIAISNFIDPNFHINDFLDGQYQFGPGLNASAIDNFHNVYKSYYDKNRFLDLDDYKASENISAGYMMAELNIGSKLMILPGFRYEETSNDYDGNFGALSGNLGQQGAIRDTVGGHNYGELLPMIHVRYKIVPQFDIRAAVTRSISRPDYFNLVPYERINYAENTIERGNAELEHTTSWNYDLFFSLYNRYGLFTLGLFYKDLTNIAYISQSRIVGGNFNGFQITQPTNSDKSKVYGLELDLQTNLSFLPSPFDGVVLGVNYTRLHSETQFPFFEIGPRSTLPPFRPTIINGFRQGRLPGQADNIANLSFGYEKGNFSGRVSLMYQGKVLQTVGVRSQLDGFTDSFTRWDAQASYKVISGFSVFIDFNNITNVSEGAFLGIESFPTREEFFGWTGDLGVQYRF